MTTQLQSRIYIIHCQRDTIDITYIFFNQPKYTLYLILSLREKKKNYQNNH